METEERGGRRRTEGLKGPKRERETSGVTRRGQRSSTTCSWTDSAACYFFLLHTTSVHTTPLSPLSSSSSSLGTHLLYGVVVTLQLPPRVAICAAKTPFEYARAAPAAACSAFGGRSRGSFSGRGTPCCVQSVSHMVSSESVWNRRRQPPAQSVKRSCGGK